MCYPKPGPRCSAHAAELLQKAKIRRRAASGFDFEARQAVDDAQLEYDATPAGIRELERRIGQDVNSASSDGTYELRLQLGRAKREERLAAVKMKDQGDVLHEGPSQEASYPASMQAFTTKTEEYPSESLEQTGPEITAMVQDSTHWVRKLNTDEIEAASWYTSNGSSHVNNYLLGHDQEQYGQKIDKKQAAEAVAHLDSALEKAERKTPVKLYRGISHDILEREGFQYEEEDKYIDAKLPVGSTFESPVFQSSTLDFKRGRGFATSQVMLEILAKKAAPVSNISAWGVSESEYILPRNQKYRVVGIREHSTTHGSFTSVTKIVQVEQI